VTPPIDPAPARLEVVAVTGLGEVVVGDDLAALLAAHADLREGDVVVVTSKVVSKAEGRVRRSSREDAVAAETESVVARRGPTTIARTRHGLVMAAAGVDASNTAPGSVVLLPEDPDASARRLRARLATLTGTNLAVLVSDTSGRAWRTGQTDIAVGAAGLSVLDDHAGRDDGYGNLLAVTVPALADEVAGAADLVKGKLGRTPAAVVRGLADRVLPPAEDGPGAAALVRPESADLFGLGAREAATVAACAAGAAVEGTAARGTATPRGFGAPSGPTDLRAAAARVLVSLGLPPHLADAPGGGLRLDLGGTDPLVRVRAETLLAVVAAAHGWHPAADGSGHLTGLLPPRP
jgi:coenzyme F420-0:L-glutamate ligase/coenzyme F420-1:gamma-L-glutamate ligase